MTRKYLKLNREKAYIWRIIHLDNITNILDNGLLCKNHPNVNNSYVNIGNMELIDKRSTRNVPVHPNGTLSDYIPFYFTPFSPMMYNIYTGRGVPRRSNEEIVILVSSLPTIQEAGLKFVFTDRHAYPVTTTYYNSLDDLGVIDWSLLQDRNFRRNPDDPAQIERYQAEALIHYCCPTAALLGIVCYSESVKSSLEDLLKERALSMQVEVIKGWYF